MKRYAVTIRAKNTEGGEIWFTEYVEYESVSSLEDVPESIRHGDAIAQVYQKCPRFRDVWAVRSY
jgi:hypothetical protein